MALKKILGLRCLVKRAPDFFWKKLSPKLSKQPLLAAVKKYKSYSSLVEKYDIFSLQTIRFRYALKSLLGIK